MLPEHVENGLADLKTTLIELLVELESLKHAETPEGRRAAREAAEARVEDARKKLETMFPWRHKP